MLVIYIYICCCYITVRVWCDHFTLPWCIAVYCLVANFSRNMLWTILSDEVLDLINFDCDNTLHERRRTWIQNSRTCNRMLRYNNIVLMLGFSYFWSSKKCPMKVKSAFMGSSIQLPIPALCCANIFHFI
jgi:hypothetical protein